MSSPTQPGAARRRATGIRRPRVAGRVPGRPTGPVTPDVGGGSLPPSTPRRRADLDRPSDGETNADSAGVDSAGVDPAGPDPAAADLAGDDGPGESRDGSGAGVADRTSDDRTSDDSSPDGRPQDQRPAVDNGRAQPSGKRQVRRGRAVADPVARRLRKPIPVPVLVAALALAVGLAVFFGIAVAQLRGTPAAQNTALVDIGTTAQVSQQVDDALKTIYSFDYTRLDQNEAAARAVITPGFAAQFDNLFNQVRQLAPQQQAVVTATVNLSAVKSINGDTAVLVVFLDQQATRAQAGTQPQQLAAAGRLTVTAQLVDGTWKVADVQPR